MCLTFDNRPLEPIQQSEFSHAHEHDHSISSVGIDLPGDLDADRFNEWLGKLLREKGADIFRMKGIVSIQGEPRQFVFQAVHMIFDGQPDKPWGSRPRRNQLVFIGRHLDRQALLSGFQDSLV
ncbi:GTP-binding protein [Kamptonema cortianum]|nr:GTP-binding protein [Oscillatoria laete-virens]MDK3159638.1 GTP-binding protein [Kamptonema cortianum]MDL5050287.1 GTP-binding protein [Oscillatoria amoena NRMC-F 0135]MDL5055120.1 GTP-binding protein [Oscillatoria laete-virens NRMC-F 0139]